MRSQSRPHLRGIVLSVHLHRLYPHCRKRRPKVDASHLLQEMLRALAATREAQESENRRRLAWERELEAKYQQRQAETESQLAEMKRQIAYLKACVASLLHHGREGMAHVASSSGYLLDEPGSPSLACAPGAGSTKPPPLVSPGNVISERSQSHGLLVDALSRSVSPCPSNRKRPTPSQNHERSDSDNSGSEASVSSTEKRPPKRVNNRDKTCYTIQVFYTTHSEMSAYFSQTAMRRHIYHALGVSPEDELPPSHCEGLPLGDNEPVRFVWEKTTKQSKHNALMKERVLASLKANRKLYEHVPEADFALKTISTAFDQAFATFRQKYRIQRDPSVSFTVRNREEQKSMKSRRLHRKKVVRITFGHISRIYIHELLQKREQRHGMRERTQAFAHATFDGAMELDCMSSEESDDESKQSAAKERAFIVRGLPWRSNRLLKFYSVLDEDERLDKSMKPKRGLGRRDRNEGPPRDILTFPPKGIASWMISRRWLRELQMAHPEVLPEVLQAVQELVHDPPGFDWTKFDALGYETDDECVGIEPNTVQHGAQFVAHPSAYPNSTTSYALVDALAPTS
jgi:hypothetical protein